ncbi:cytochrome P450 [Zychaea mexicana]|uniref:cytochrome P450 n=1 Tax=Zychaea mexicana TaxID=64656 RepID=UPI0022FE009E|nr:cytochrome P450 [Zychaea mexicana]KAI9477132.1 cytochrome P450 [Zychaea mexicana]
MDIISDDALTSLHKDRVLPFASAVTAAALTAYAFYRRYYQDSINNVPPGLRGIPSPSAPLPYAGHLFFLGSQPVIQLMQWHQELGPVIRIQMGVKTWLMISDPHIAQELLVASQNSTSGRPFTLLTTKYRSMNGRGLVSSGPTKSWRQVRTVANAILGPKKLNDERFAVLLDDQVDRLVDALATGENIDPADVLFRTALNFVLITCFGRSTSSTPTDNDDDQVEENQENNTKEQEEQKKKDDALYEELSAVLKRGNSFTGIRNNFTTYLPALSFLDAAFFKTEDAYKEYIEKERDPLYRRLIKETLQSGEECVVKSLADMKEMGQLDDDDILVTAADLVTAGTETMAATLQWAFAVLSTQCEAQEKIQEELADFISEYQRLPDFSERNAFPYLVAVQKECMRFRPTTPFGESHEVEQDVTWRDHVIPAGTTIVTNMYSMHTNLSSYKNPEEFMPERFLDHTAPMASSANAKVEQRDHFNFGWGRRVCPGAHLAEAQMFNVLVRVLANCSIEPARDEKGDPVIVDIDNVLSNGNVVTPGEYQLRFVRHDHDEDLDDDDEDAEQEEAGDSDENTDLEEEEDDDDSDSDESASASALEEQDSDEDL